MNATVFNLELLNPPAEPMPIELGRVLSESQAARRGWRALSDDERTSMSSYVASAREPHVRERRAGLVFMSLVTIAPRT
jgi:hypothetical protein